MADLSFLDKEKLHTGFGEVIENASSYNDVLVQAGLNWSVSVYPLNTEVNGQSIIIPGKNAVVRNEDLKPLGVVSEKYKIVNNEDAFAFTESLFNTKEIEFIRGGSYRGGSATWLEAKVTGQYSILGDNVDCYLIFMNTHDGTGSVKCMIAPERLACMNILNMPLKDKSRHWRCIHSGDPLAKIDEARDVLLAGSSYMESLKRECEVLQSIKLSDKTIYQFINRLFPVIDTMTEKQKENQMNRRTQLFDVFYSKEDLTDFGSTGYKFISAVVDYVDHKNGKNTKHANINRYMNIANGNPLVDEAYMMVLTA